MESIETTELDGRVPARTLPLLLAFMTLGAVVLIFTLQTVNARSDEELRKHLWSRRAHIGISYWMQHGYFRTAGVPVREHVEGTRPRLYFYRSTTGAYMLSGLLFEKLYTAFTGRYGWQALGVHHQVISLLTSALLAVLAFRVAVRLGLRPLHAFVVAVITQTVFFTFPGNLVLYWEMTEMQWFLLLTLLFMLLEERNLDREPSRRATLLRAVVVFLLTYVSVTTGLFFVAAYIAVRLVLDGRLDRRLLLAMVVPAVAAVAIYAAQLAWVSWKYPAMPKLGSSVMFRSGFDGSRAYYNDHGDIVKGRQPAKQKEPNERLRRPWLFGGGLVAVLVLLVAYARGRIAGFPVLVIASIAGTYLLIAGIFSQAVVIHPHLYDPIVALPLILAMFVAVPALLETLTRCTGVFVLMTVFAGYVHANANIREFAKTYPLASTQQQAAGAAAKPGTAGAATTAADASYGVWKTVPYAATNFSADAGAWTVEPGDQGNYAYTYLGPKTMMVTFDIRTSDVTGTPRSLQLLIPDGKSAASPTGTACRIGDAGQIAGGFAAVRRSNLILIQTIDAKRWKPTDKDDTFVFGSITFQIR